MKRFILIILLAVAALAGCRQKLEYTTVELADPVRHYYPILQGQELTIIAKLTNTGEVPLLVEDVQPSCGCMVTDFKGDVMVPPDQSMFVTVRYSSYKNVGKVEHSLRFWGNIKPDGMAELRFDVNVVPDANFHRDYEELYQENLPAASLRDLVTGTGSETGLGYYTDL